MLVNPDLLICTILYHAVQSLINPLAIVIAPTLVRSNFNSAKIRAKTGNAYMICKYTGTIKIHKKSLTVIDMATPRKSKKLPKLIL